MEFINNQIKIKGDKHIFNIRTILFITINIGIFIYMINFFDNLLEVNTILRKLEDDPRTKGSNEVCMKIIDNDLYDLFGLENKIYNVTNNIKLRLCDNIDGYKSSCIYKNGDITNNLAGDIKGEENNKNKIEVTNEIVKIYLAAGNKFKNDQRYKVNIEIKCNNSYDFEIEEVSQFDPNSNDTLIIKAKSKKACVQKDYYGSDIGLVFRILIGIALLGVGVYVGIFGYRGRKIGIFLVCISGFVLLSVYILDLFNEKNLVIKIVVMVVFGLVGIGLSIFFIYKQKFLKIYMVLVGGITGYLLAITINNLFISIIDTEHQKLIRIIVIVVIIIVGVVFGIFLTKGTFIVGTSIIGSYCLMRAMSLFLYGVVTFVNELKIYDLAKHGNYEVIEEDVLGLFLIYPSMLVIFIVVTIIVQFKLNPKWRDVEDYKLLEKDFDKPIELPDFKMNKDDEDECEEEAKE